MSAIVMLVSMPFQFCQDGLYRGMDAIDKERTNKCGKAVTMILSPLVFVADLALEILKGVACSISYIALAVFQLFAGMFSKDFDARHFFVFLELGAYSIAKVAINILLSPIYFIRYEIAWLAAIERKSIGNIQVSLGDANLMNNPCCGS